MEPMFLELLFQAPRWFFTIYWTSILGLWQKTGFLESMLEVLGFQALLWRKLRMHAGRECGDTFLLLRDFLLRATAREVLELRSS